MKNKKRLLVLILGFSMAIGSGPVFTSAQNVQQLDHILGRPMDEEEERQQEAMVPELHGQPTPDDIAEPVLDGELRARSSYQGIERFDLRDKGLVTGVKNQGEDGTCWAFTTIAMAEASMLKERADLLDVLDLSEGHLAYFFYNREDDPLGNTAGDKNVINWQNYDYKSIGGNPQLASKFLSTWSGVADEETAPYPADAPVLDSSLAYESRVRLQDAYFIDASVDEIKAAMYTTEQPVGINYYHSAAYYNKSTGAYCDPQKESGINHAVTIVGWDDTYKKENFLPASNVSENGAWIVKNSWGDAHGDGGYIYISYEDKNISGAVSGSFQLSGNYAHNYQYDGSSGSSSVSVPAGASHANVFQVEGNPSGSEILKAVGILMKTANAALSVDVYTELKDPADPTSGIHAVESQPVTTSYSGFHTIPLEKEIPLREGSHFSVIFTNASDGAESFFIESTTDSQWIRFEAGVGTGQSFYRGGEGQSWKDMAQDYIKGGRAVNARIKAYTVDSSEVIPTVVPSPVETPVETPAETPAGEPTTTPSVEPSVTPDAPPTGTPPIVSPMAPSPTPPKETPTGTPSVTPAATPTTLPSATPTATPPGMPTPPPSVTPATAPGSVSIRKLSLTEKGVKVRWEKIAGVSRYEVYRKRLPGGEWELLGTTAGTFHEDGHVSPATAYRYRVRAVNGTGSTASPGAYSSVKEILTRPDIPTKRTLEHIGKRSRSARARLRMRPSAGADIYYIYQYDRRTEKYRTAYKISGKRVYIYQRSEKRYKKIGKVRRSGGKLVCTLTGIDLEGYRKQFFKVRAYVKRSGIGGRYSGYSGKITLKR